MPLMLLIVMIIKNSRVCVIFVYCVTNGIQGVFRYTSLNAELQKGRGSYGGDKAGAGT